MKISFEWSISERDKEGFVLVRERLVGSDHLNTFGPMRWQIAESFVKARRAFVNRTVLTRTQAVQIFEPPRNILDLPMRRNLQ